MKTLNYEDTQKNKKTPLPHSHIEHIVFHIAEVQSLILCGYYVTYVVQNDFLEWTQIS